MERTRVIIVATLLAIVAIVLPIAGMLYFSWVSAINEEHTRLELFAHQVIVRAGITFNEAKVVLKTINSLNYDSCSSEHIEHMRTLTINTPSIEEIGYFQNGILKCTSWGITPGEAKQSPADFTMPDGLGITLRIQPLISKSHEMMALQLKNHNVLVNPHRFIDVIADPDMQFAVVTQKGYLLGASANISPDLIKEILSHPSVNIDSEHLIAISRSAGLISIGLEPRSVLQEKFLKQQELLLPLGALLAVFMVGIIYWLSRRRLSPLGELRIAVKKEEFVVFYQPIVDLKTHACIGAEALIRWKRPDGTIVSPDFFIPIAEESGLILLITDQIIRQVTQNLKSLLNDNKKIHISINLCAEDIQTGRFLDTLQTAVAQTGIRPQQIWLEATERGFVDVAAARTTLTRARALGFGVAIDDFGTGYSSLSNLQGFPLDALKIDKAFIDTIETGAATSTVTPHIIDMAKTLGLQIIAEGVETQAQVSYLLKQNVEFGQGWFFSKALSASDFIEYCKKHSV